MSIKREMDPIDQETIIKSEIDPIGQLTDYVSRQQSGLNTITTGIDTLRLGAPTDDVTGHENVMLGVHKFELFELNSNSNLIRDLQLNLRSYSSRQRQEMDLNHLYHISEAQIEYFKRVSQVNPPFNSQTFCDGFNNNKLPGQRTVDVSIAFFFYGFWLQLTMDTPTERPRMQALLDQIEQETDWHLYRINDHQKYYLKDLYNHPYTNLDFEQWAGNMNHFILDQAPHLSSIAWVNLYNFWVQHLVRFRRSPQRQLHKHQHIQAIQNFVRSQIERERKFYQRSYIV